MATPAYENLTALAVRFFTKVHSQMPIVSLYLNQRDLNIKVDLKWLKSTFMNGNYYFD